MDSKRNCVEVYMVYRICVGDQVIVKVGREIVKGTVTKVSPTALLLDDRVIVRISRVSWLEVVNNDSGESA